jgi:hypothetical protein
MWNSTCFGRHTTHHQEPKTALVASGFSYVKGCWWTLSGTVCAWQRPPTTRPTTFHIWKTRGYQCSFRLLMMGSVLPETCWASYKYGIIKFWYIVASCWIFLNELFQEPDQISFMQPTDSDKAYKCPQWEAQILLNSFQWNIPKQW